MAVARKVGTGIGSIWPYWILRKRIIGVLNI